MGWIGKIGQLILISVSNTYNRYDRNLYPGTNDLGLIEENSGGDSGKMHGGGGIEQKVGGDSEKMENLRCFPS